jgi:hypothetical protein
VSQPVVAVGSNPVKDLRSGPQPRSSEKPINSQGDHGINFMRELPNLTN